MATLLSVVAGWTKRLGPFTLRVDGQPLDLTGLTIELSLRDSLDAPVSVVGVTITPDPDQTTHKGEVYFKPLSTTFQFLANADPDRQWYRIRWKVTDSGPDVVYFPNDDPDMIKVTKP